MPSAQVQSSGTGVRQPSLSFRKLHKSFVAEASPVDLRQVTDKERLDQIRAALDEYAVVVFRKQAFEKDDQLVFAERLDGEVTKQSKTALILGKATRLGYEGMIDVSNLNEKGEIWAADDRRRMTRMGNRFWHTDHPYRDPVSRYSLLWAKTVPPVSSPTEFADLRAAYEAFSDKMKAQLDSVKVFFSSTRGQEILGFDFQMDESKKQKTFPTAIHPLVHTIPRTNRRSLFLSVHADHIVDMPKPEGRMVLLEVTEHATKPQFVYSHEWEKGDLVIWDNRTTMHRRPPFDDLEHVRELVRVTTVDNRE